jgi:lipoprotein-anchoring transpeptidase ErfK/SrfK
MGVNRLPGEPEQLSGATGRNQAPVEVREELPQFPVARSTRRPRHLPRRSAAAHASSDRRQSLNTHTPRQYFAEDTVRLSSDRPGAPFALALSARSHVYKQFDGGPGQIAIHGLANLGGELRTAASHGCGRLATSSITWLAMRIGEGVPVTIP